MEMTFHSGRDTLVLDVPGSCIHKRGTEGEYILSDLEIFGHVSAASGSLRLMQLFDPAKFAPKPASGSSSGTFECP